MTDRAGAPDHSTTNVVLLIAIGLIVSVWLVIYTDAFPVITALFGVGGLLAWTAFVLPILTSDRRQHLQGLFDTYFIQKRCTTWFLTVIGLVAIVFLFGHGTIEIDNRSGDGYSSKNRRLSMRTVRDIEEITPDTIKYDRFVPKESLSRTATWAPWRKRVAVKISGLPQVEVYVKSLRRTRLVITDSFRPGVVVGPVPDLVNAIRNSTSHLRVCVEDIVLVDEPDYNAQVFWLGVYFDVAIPSSIDVSPQESPIQRTLPGANRRLKFGDKVVGIVTIKNQKEVRHAYGKVVLDKDDAKDGFAFLLDLQYGSPPEAETCE